MKTLKSPLEINCPLGSSDRIESAVGNSFLSGHGRDPWGLFSSQSSDAFVILHAICYQGVNCFQMDEMCLNWAKWGPKSPS